MGRGGHSSHLTAVAVSPAVSPREPDWPPYVHATGYCLWDVPAGWREPKALTAFFDGSRPVVAVSFGSIAPWAGPAFEHLYEAAVDAVLALGARALVIGSAAASRERVLAIPFAPFSLVYPRCVAAIHHGGANTTGEALRAGIPALAVPWGIDQFFTAGQLVRTGAGRTRHRRKFGAAVARRDLKALLEEPGYLRNAQAMAERIAREDGVAALCDRIEQVLGGGHHPWRA
jgi:UDP:flavonoid glycosyltransferase YjiC (YdhE family)